MTEYQHQSMEWSSVECREVEAVLKESAMLWSSAFASAAFHDIRYTPATRIGKEYLRAGTF